MNRLILFIVSIHLIAASYGQKVEFCITDFGAVADGKTVNTVFIQQTIDKASINGGKVIVPSGIYITGSIYLKSNIEFHLMPGAVILGSSNIIDYPELEAKNNDKDRHPHHLLVINNCENVSITGSGEINGNGYAFWESERKSAFHFYREKEKRPSPLIEINACNNIQLSGIKITNSPGWTLHLYNSDALKINNITIKNDLFGPNTDGIDINGCRDVIIASSNIKAGDDAVVLKTTRDSRSCENVNVTGCILETNCVAMKLGTESYHNFRNVIFSNIIVKNCSRVFSLICNDGAEMNNIRVSNVTAQTNTGWILNRIIEINANKRNEKSNCGSIKNVFVDGMNVLTDGRILVGAANGSIVENISLKNIHLQFALLDDPKMMAEKTENDPLYFRSLPWLRGARAAIAAQNIKHLTIEGLTIKWPTYPLDSTWQLLKSSENWGNEAYLPANKSRIINQCR